ncbi:cAMP-regulated phosphoprotein 21 isoform X2 [Diorhabda carinulata]|uniref:cAMP-regulated phosphoprotein 21 isoform X2 n=1 Tax=Diorhabda carinulata TaxID=1163345 RepID=UPI0025A04D6F|nr:cAMP-regulated phosphoprotein 21 isoform X2 [Diorhabda carinulata]XP_057655107.1 cAMP-regulated phosphoprotein 21 isoform X2 [Diorhabda carinulata]
MQQRGSTTTMDNEVTDNSSSTPSSRVSRNNSKLKVLVRSHAMREETSPPREPSPNLQHHQQQYHQSETPLLSPRITLIPSPEISSSPLVVLSPSTNSPSICKSPQCLSPTSTLVPTSPNNSRSSPNLCASVENITRIERLQSDCFEEGVTGGYVTSSPKFTNKNSSKLTSHSFKKKNSCECQTPNCLKCTKNQERTINNNLTNVNNNMTGSPNTLMVARVNSKGKLRQQSSSLGSFDSSLNSPCLSRDSSSELYTDTTGVDLEQFIPETLNRNAKDRALMLRIEQELVNLAKDKCKTHYKFPPMSSYQRMLVHRCAAYFGMDHNIEPTGKSVIVNKTKNTRIPDIEFKEHVKDDIIFSEEPRRSILKRDSNSIDDYSFKSPDRSFGSESRRSKSIEEREEEYEKARRRIFNRELRDESSEDFGWSEMPWSSTESEYSARYRLQMPEMHHRHSGKLTKGHSEETGEALRPCVAKSYSFGGYGGSVSVLSRGDSVMSTHSAGPRFLTKQDSGASSVSWRLSPSSSGYKSQSQMSESVTPSPTSTPHPSTDAREDSNCEEDRQDTECIEKTDDNHVVWAVTDLQDVPKGCLIINPQTGQPLKNEDGTLYHYDPDNLPPSIVQTPSKPPPPSPHKQQQSPKKSQSRKSHVTNSSTSPSLPFSPPLSTTTSDSQKNFPYAQTDQQQYPSFHATYSSPPSVPEPAPVYQQPYIVYSAPYGVYMPQQYDGRMEVPSAVTVSEVANNAYYLPDNPAPPPPPPAAQPIAYQPTQPNQFWNQPIAYYQNNSQATTATPPRYPSVPLQNPAQAAFISPGYPQPNFITPSSHQIPTATDIPSVYPNQPVQVVYQNQPPPPNTVYYQNQPPIIYSQTPMYQSATSGFPPQLSHQPIVHQPNLPAYPQGTSTPNGCHSSTGADQQTLYNLAQSIQHMNLGGGSGPCQSFLGNKVPPAQYDFRQRQVNNGLKGKPFKCFLMGSSQSSTGTNSPAGTVIAAYCPQNPGTYRTPTETPPHQFPFPPNFTPPAIFKQVPNMRATTPGTAKSSRSPTPASDVTYFDRQKMALPTNVYPGIPYMVPSGDPRLISGRGQPNVYRPSSAQMNRPVTNQGPDNRTKSRKPKTNKQTGLPPSGK